MANLKEVNEWVSGIYQLETTDPVIGGPPNLSLGQGMSNVQAQQLAQRTSWLRYRLANLNEVEPVSVSVGSGGDFASLNAALEELSRYRFGYLSTAPSLATITLRAGFVMEEQVLLRGVSLGFITIEGEDPVTTIARDALLSNALRPEASRFPAFGGVEGAILPRINHQFEMDTSGEASGRAGIGLTASSIVVENGGVRNAGDSAVLASDASRFFAAGSDFSGARNNGLDATGAATAFVHNCDFSGAQNNGLKVRRGSSVSAANANAQRTPGTNSSSDFFVREGGIIDAHAAVGGLSQAANTITSNGIIFQ